MMLKIDERKHLNNMLRDKLQLTNYYYQKQNFGAVAVLELEMKKIETKLMKYEKVVM